jgi:hypothetical protein
MVAGLFWGGEVFASVRGEKEGTCGDGKETMSRARPAGRGQSHENRRKVGAGGAGASLCLPRTGRGVALGSITSPTAGALFLVSLAFLAAILLDIW